MCVCHMFIKVLTYLLTYLFVIVLALYFLTQLVDQLTKIKY